jgi:hypothetical protein
MRSRLSQEQLEREIVALQELGHAELKEKWRGLFGIDPPFKIRAGFLRRAIAYKLQAETFGGLSAGTRRKLLGIAQRASRRSGAIQSGSPPRSAPSLARLSPGTRLVREWRGELQTVEVTSTGYLWGGGTYRTLSAVAVAITGTKWSGPKFFGLYKGGARS